ncbi:MAG: carbohydrate binding family 9 domain-containing protein [Acidobacteriota bacterium]|nr:carbohydrate binding family 9 domain-containing protein [Acidobacteriota bacterium]
MKKLCALLFILISAVYTQAQDTSSAEASEVKSADAKSSQNLKSSGKFNLPPEKANPVKVAKFAAAPVIDGRLDDEAWKSAQILKDFVQTGPGDNVAPSKLTEVMLGYDEKNFYIAFRCFDEKDKIRATVAKRDNVFGEDNVRVWLDTYNDQRRAYVLGFNPLGIQQDGIFTEGQGADYSVDIVMESKGVIEDWGWSVEVQIPFKSLRYTAGKDKLWGFNAARNIDRFNDEFDSWLPDDRNISGFLIKHGKLAGMEGIKVERTLEIAPSITVSESGRRRRTIFQSTVNNLPPGASLDPGRFLNEGLKQDIGVNFKLNITPNVTLDAAYNPDFAEIEADAAVVTANQRFPIFFQEKRPFFLEGSEIFGSPLQTFYSRTIIDPDLATKLTGKIGKNSFGFLVASDKAPGNYSEEERDDPGIRPRLGEFLDKNAYFGVVRVKRDFGEQNNVGFFGTMRVFPRQRNFTSGFDGTFKLNPKTVMTFQVVGTHSRRTFYNPETNRAPYRTGNGLGYFWSLDYTEKNRGWYLEAFGRSRYYRADAGFTRRTNTNSFLLAGRLSTEPKPKAKLIRTDWRQFARLNYDWKGRSQDGFIGTNLQFQLQGNLFISTEMGIGYERLFEAEFGPIRRIRPDGSIQNGAFFGAPERSAYQPYVNMNFNKTVSKKLSLRAFTGLSWNNFDFDFGNGIGSGFETRFPRISPAFSEYLNSADYLEYLRLRALNPNDPNNFPPNEPPLDPGRGTQFDLQAGFTYKPIDPLNISFDYTKSKLTRYDTDRAAFDANIVTLRSTYQFTRFIFARTRIDYNSLASNVSGQMLLGWNPSPGTALYVGYNDNFNYNGFSPYTGQLEPRFERNNRTFFIRASYLFRKSF